MRRAGGLVLLAAVAAGCSTGSIDDLPTAAGSSGATLSARLQAVPASAVPRPGPVLPAPVSGGSAGALVPPQPAPDDHAVPRPVPVQVPSSPLEAFRWLEYRCSADTSLLNRGRDGPYPPVEPDRFSGAVLLRESPRGQALIEDGRGTRVVLESWSTSGRLLPESGRVGDPMPEPYRSSCPSAVATG